MTRSFFQHLDQEGVRWLLVSGQATILYGAATFSEFKQLVAEHEIPSALLPADSVLRAAVETLSSGGPLTEELEDELDEWFDRRVAPLRKADRRFWRPVIEELREMRKSGQLVAEGTPV